MSRRHEAEDDSCLNGFEYHSLGKCFVTLSEVTTIRHSSVSCHPGPASLSVLQLNRSELVHMRHVMVKIELDSRLQGGQREVDTLMARYRQERLAFLCNNHELSDHPETQLALAL